MTFNINNPSACQKHRIQYIKTYWKNVYVHQRTQRYNLYLHLTFGCSRFLIGVDVILSGIVHKWRHSLRGRVQGFCDRSTCTCTCTFVLKKRDDWLGWSNLIDVIYGRPYAKVLWHDLPHKKRDKGKKHKGSTNVLSWRHLWTTS